MTCTASGRPTRRSPSRSRSEARWVVRRSLVTMKHVGVNVAADPLLSACNTGVNAGLVILAADDPSMFSSQNEQDCAIMPPSRASDARAS